ncbi:Type IV pilus biogenesis protein PilM [Chitinispirillum alkaliphilum]|nr:Type IV pilus biogenesis protein PilM [Chitinispirillum alkaliphilum]
MQKKKAISVGIETNSHFLRAVKLGRNEKSKTHTILGMEEIRGDYSNDQNLVDSLKKVKDKLSISPFDRVITCLGGKKTFVYQLKFRRLPEEEMKNALRLEIRKSLPFDISAAIIDYLISGESNQAEDYDQVIVTAVTSTLLNRHLGVFKRAGIKPVIVDLLPLAAANSFWESNRGITASDSTQVMLHIGPKFTNIIIDGNKSSFFHRTVYFDAIEVFDGDQNTSNTNLFKNSKLLDLRDEVMRTLTFYSNSFNHSDFSSIHLMGDFSNKDMAEFFLKHSNIPTEVNDLARSIYPHLDNETEKFNIATSLSMR